MTSWGRMAGFCGLLGSSSAILGCFATSGAAEPLVRAHAEDDLDCPGSEIRIQEELGNRYKAVGCGRKAYYKAACQALECVVRGEDEGDIPMQDRPDPQDPAYDY